jgi:hypothetical protein
MKCEFCNAYTQHNLEKNIMTFETKQEVLEKILDQKKPMCPHCGCEMQMWEVPPMPFSDGLGWGTPYMFLCFNDECPPYKKGWEDMEQNYGQKASYRCICYPGTENFEFLPVFSPFGATGQIVDEQVLAEEAALKESTIKGFSILTDCYNNKDWLTALNLLLDAAQPPKVRLKAADMLGDIGELDIIDSMKTYKFGNKLVQEKVNDSIIKIHERFFTRECPFCAEIIKKRAKICKHCQKEVAGV